MDAITNPGMSQSIYLLSSKLAAQQRQFTVISDNVANVNTPGFKRLTYNYETESARKNGTEVGDFVKHIGVLIDHTEGVKSTTNNPFDMAIHGEGFFAIETAQGTKYSRDGHFTLNNLGQIVTAKNEPLLSNAGAPITVPAGAQNLQISADGSISSNGGIIGTIGLYNFAQDELQQLNRAGNGFFAPDGIAAQLVENPRVHSGQIETANINAVEEMIQLKQLTHSYQSAIRRIRAMEDLEERAIRTLATSPQ